MTMSIHTNQAALTAFRVLSGTEREGELIRERIVSGKRVNSAKDNASSYSISKDLIAEKSSLGIVAQSINNAKSVLDVALSGANAVSDLLINMKEKAVALKAETDPNNKQAIVGDYNALLEQINTIVGNANFNENNLLEAGSFSALLKSDGTSLSISHEPMDATSLNLGSILTSVNTDSLNTNINLAIDKVNSKTTRLAASHRRLDSALEFNSFIRDKIDENIGTLVDADMAKEAANQQANQVKIQLGVQTLGLANQSPNQILKLFGIT